MARTNQPIIMADGTTGIIRRIMADGTTGMALGVAITGVVGTASASAERRC